MTCSTPRNTSGSPPDSSTLSTPRSMSSSAISRAWSRETCLRFISTRQKSQRRLQALVISHSTRTPELVIDRKQQI